MFLALSPIFWPWVVTIYVFPLHLRCGVLLTITGKRLISVLLFSSPSFSVRLSGICYRSDILVPCCVVVSCGVICYFSQYWSFFFFRFWLRLETTSRWVGSEFSCHWCCFPRRWFAIDIYSLLVLVFKIWFLVIWLLCSFFIVRGWLHGSLI